MNTIKKIAISLVAAVLLASVGLYLYLTPDRLRSMIVPGLESALDRKVRLDDVSLSFLGGIQASLSGFHIDDRPGFGSEAFVSTESGELSISLMALLLGQDEIGKLHIEKPTIRIVINEKGETNYSDMLVASDTQEPGAAPPVLPITHLEISNGTLVQEDRQLGSITKFESVDYSVDLTLKDAALGLEGQLTIGDIITSASDGTVSSLGTSVLGHSISLNPGVDRLDIERFEMQLGPLGLLVSGVVTRMSDESPSIDLQVSETASALAYNADGVSASGSLDIALAIIGPYNGRMDPPIIPKITGHIKVSDLSATTPDLTEKITSGKLTIDFGEDRVSLSELSANIGASDISLSGTLSRLEGLLSDRIKSNLDFDLISKNLDLDELLPATSPEAVQTSGTYWFTTPLYAATQVNDLSSPIIPLLHLFDAAGKVSVDRLVSGGVLTDVSASILSKGGKLAVNDLVGDAYGGKLRGSVNADLATMGGPFPARIAMSLSGGQADGVLQNFFNLPLPLKGAMTLNLSGSGNLDSTLTFLTKSLNLEGLGSIADGQIVNWGWMKAASGGLAQLSFLDYDRIPIKKLTSRIQVENGTLYTRGLTMTAAEIPVTVNGSTSLSDGSLNYAVDLELPADKLSVGGINLGTTLGAFFGQSQTPDVIPLQVSIKGTTNQPEISVTMKNTNQRDATKKAGRRLLNRFRNR